MTRNELIDIAGQFYRPETLTEREIAFARFIIKREREECAKICDTLAEKGSVNTFPMAMDCAKAIRDKGKNANPM